MDDWFHSLNLHYGWQRSAYSLRLANVCGAVRAQIFELLMKRASSERDIARSKARMASAAYIGGLGHTSLHTEYRHAEWRELCKVSQLDGMINCLEEGRLWDPFRSES